MQIIVLKEYIEMNTMLYNPIPGCYA